MPCFENVLFSDYILFWKEEINIFIYYTTDIIRKMFVHGNRIAANSFLSQKKSTVRTNLPPCLLIRYFNVIPVLLKGKQTNCFVIRAL